MLQVRRPKKPEPKPSFTLPVELCLLIAKEHPLVAVKLHAVNKCFREIIKKNITTMTLTIFLPGVKGVFSNSYSRQLIRGLYFYFTNKITTQNLEKDVNALISHIESISPRFNTLHMLLWLMRIPESRLITADARAYMTKVIQTTRAYYGSLYLGRGNDRHGIRGFALSFLALAETAFATQFKGQHCGETDAYKFTWRNVELQKLWDSRNLLSTNFS